MSKKGKNAIFDKLADKVANGFNEPVTPESRKQLKLLKKKAARHARR